MASPGRGSRTDMLSVTLLRGLRPRPRMPAGQITAEEKSIFSHILSSNATHGV